MDEQLLHQRDVTIPIAHEPSGLEIRLTMAPVLYGSNLAWMLLGFIFVQTYTYYRHSQHDRPLFKAFVYTIVSIEVAATGLECYVGYRYLVGGWGDPTGSVVEVPPKAFLFQPLFDAILGTMVQCFFAWRIWNFAIIGGSKMKYLTNSICLFIVLLSLAAISCAVAFPILFFRVDSQPELWVTTRPAVVTWTVSSAVADVFISGCMVVILQHARSRSYFEETRDTISRLIRLTVQTGTLTSLLAISIIVVFLKEPFGNMHTFPAYLLGKSYAMSLLANVNARIHRQGSKNYSSTETQPPLAFSPPRTSRNLFSSTFSGTFDAGVTSDQYSSDITSGTLTSMIPRSRGTGQDAKLDGEDPAKLVVRPSEIQGDIIQLQSMGERGTSLRYLSDFMV